MRQLLVSRWIINVWLAGLFVLSVAVFGLNWLSWLLLAVTLMSVTFDVGIRALARRKGFDLDGWRRRRFDA